MGTSWCERKFLFTIQRTVIGKWRLYRVNSWNSEVSGACIGSKVESTGAWDATVWAAFEKTAIFIWLKGFHLWRWMYLWWHPRSGLCCSIGVPLLQKSLELLLKVRKMHSGMKGSLEWHAQQQPGHNSFWSSGCPSLFNLLNAQKKFSLTQSLWTTTTETTTTAAATTTVAAKTTAATKMVKKIRGLDL